MIYIGIDPGVNTGYAEWSVKQQKFLAVDSGTLNKVLVRLYRLEDYRKNVDQKAFIHVFMEDARQRKWYGTTAQNDRARLQGAGSIKRDCQIIEDACKDWGIPITLVAPKNNVTKLSAEQFKKLTGWQGRTNEHARDAAMLVFQFKPTKNN